MPGFLREFWATVEKTGTYRGQCSELCGKEHGFMPVVVNVVTQEQFAQWLASKKPAAVKAPVAAAAVGVPEPTPVVATAAPVIKPVLLARAAP